MARMKWHGSRRDTVQLAVIVITDVAAIVFAVWLVYQLAVAFRPGEGSGLLSADPAEWDDWGDEDGGEVELAAVLPFPARRAGAR